MPGLLRLTLLQIANCLERYAVLFDGRDNKLGAEPYHHERDPEKPVAMMSMSGSRARHG